MKISVIGLGKLGQPLCCVFAKKYKVIGIDKVFNKIEEPGLEELYGKVRENIHYTCSYSDLGDLTFIIVPTPSIRGGAFTSKYVEDVLKTIKKRQSVVIVSTLYPGETDRLQNLFPRLKITYSPTFIALGSVIQNLTNPDMILIGSENEEEINKVKEIYTNVCTNKPKFLVLSPLSAEITKLAVNCYITMKITFANQIGNLCHKLGISGRDICNAVGTDKRIGTKYLRPGLGYGGCCFPRDNKALTRYFLDNKTNPELFQTIDGLNNDQIDEIVERVKKLNPKSIGFESLSFKEGTSNTECSQLLSIFEILKDSEFNAVLGPGEINLDWWGIKEDR